MSRRGLRVVMVVAVVAAIGLHAAPLTTAAESSGPRTAGFKYEQEAASDDFLRAVVGCERRQLACPGPTEAVVFTGRSDNVIRVFVQRAPDGRLRRPRLPNGRNEKVRLLSVLELQHRAARDPTARALHYVVHFRSPSHADVNVVYQSLFHFGALNVSAGACGQSDYVIRQERKGWVCGGAKGKTPPRRPRR